MVGNLVDKFNELILMYNIATLKKMKIKAEKLTEVTAALYC